MFFLAFKKQIKWRNNFLFKKKKKIEHLDIPDLLIKIWEYNDDDHKNCAICDQNRKWCVEIARSK